MRTVRMILALVVLVTGLSLSGMMAPQKADAATTATFQASAVVQGGLYAYQVKANGGFRVTDYRSISMDWGGCNTSWAYGVAITYTWQGVTRGPGNSWIEIGCNYTASALVRGFPMATGWYFRFKVYASGATQVYAGRL